MGCSAQRSAFLRCFNNHNAGGYTADNPVPLGKIPAMGRCAGNEFCQQAALLFNLCKQLPVLRRIYPIRTAAQNRHNLFPGLQRTNQCLGVDSVRTAGYYQCTAAGNLIT